MNSIENLLLLCKVGVYFQKKNSSNQNFAFFWVGTFEREAAQLS